MTAGPRQPAVAEAATRERSTVIVKLPFGEGIVIRHGCAFRMSRKAATTPTNRVSSEIAISTFFC